MIAKRWVKKRNVHDATYCPIDSDGKVATAIAIVGGMPDGEVVGEFWQDRNGKVYVEFFEKKNG